MNGSATAAGGCAQGERGVRSREFERWQWHLISSRKALPDAKSHWPGGGSTAARPAASRSWSESSLAARADYTRSRTRCCQYIAHAGRGFQQAGEHTCAPLNAARLGGDAAAHGWRIRVPPPLHLTAVCEGIVHARGVAALTQILVTWQRGQDDILAPVRKLLPSERDIARLM